MTTTTLILISAAVLSIVISLMAAFTARTWSPAAALASLAVLFFTPGMEVSPDSLAFWSVAAVIALGINMLLPREISTSHVGVGYITGASLAGAFVGMLLSGAGIIIGAVAGALCGGIAFCRTPAGQVLGFPSRKFFNYLCAKGLPIVTVTSIAVISVSKIYSGLYPF